MHNNYCASTLRNLSDNYHVLETAIIQVCIYLELVSLNYVSIKVDLLKLTSLFCVHPLSADDKLLKADKRFSGGCFPSSRYSTKIQYAQYSKADQKDIHVSDFLPTLSKTPLLQKNFFYFFLTQLNG